MKKSPAVFHEVGAGELSAAAKKLMSHGRGAADKKMLGTILSALGQPAPGTVGYGKSNKKFAIHHIGGGRYAVGSGMFDFLKNIGKRAVNTVKSIGKTAFNVVKNAPENIMKGVSAANSALTGLENATGVKLSDALGMATALAPSLAPGLLTASELSSTLGHGKHRGRPRKR